MSIKSLRAVPVAVPVRQKTSMSTRLLSKRDFLIITVTDSDTEVTGTGFCYAGTTGGRSAQAIAEEIFEPALVGADAEDISGIWHRLYQETLVQGRRGIVLRVLSAIDLALWDLLARRSGKPLAVLLGGRTGTLPAYASGGYYRPDQGAWGPALQEEIRFNQSLGFTDHKIKVGGLSPREDGDRIRAALEVIGDGRLALDANNAYRTADEAVEAVRVFERAAGDHGLWWIEEPLSPDDIAGHATIRNAVRTAVATGEVHQTRWEYRELFDRQAADILQPDFGVVGGITEWINVAKTAQTFGIPVAPHANAAVHVHVLPAISTALTIEHFALEKGIYNVEELITPETRVEFGNGTVTIPDRPGHGITFDEAKIREFAI
ncbi:MAG TPA: mandelate racemase/muconate lactonizing enzyme family protein [Trebonia sp.]|jgi:L-alanine-DL-glutamate epimerase-like enolase superfamily enzyme